MADADSLTDRPFQNVHNFRDVGCFVNSHQSSIKLKTGLFFRSARPDEASQSDRERLRNEYKIHTVIDLRTKSEHIQQAQKRATPLPSAAPVSPPNTVAAEPVKIPGLDYAEINFNGSSYSLALIRQLRYLSTAKLIGLMALGYRTQAISILGTEVMAAKGLVGLGIDSITHCTAEVLAVFRVLANSQSYPVIVHCTQGKDRTGLVTLLVLLLLGVDREIIKADYLLSQSELASERPAKLREVRSIGLPDEFADCPPDWIDKMVDHIDEKYGSAEKYLLRCGVTTAMQESVKETLLAAPATNPQV